MFDSLCKNEFWQCATEMNDYGKELVLEDDLDRLMWAAEHKAFPNLWKTLAAMRSANESHARDKHRVSWKKRQIFFSLLSLIQMCNPQQLSYSKRVGNLSILHASFQGSSSSAKVIVEDGLFCDR